MEKDIIEALQEYRDDCMPDMGKYSYELLDQLLVRAIDEIKNLRALQEYVASRIRRGE